MGVREETWNANFLLLVEYCRVNRHFNVPRDCEVNGVFLGKWASVQRVNRKSGKLLKEREARLNSIGFPWDLQEASWSMNFALLTQYLKVQGSLSVPTGYVIAGVELGQWVNNQKAAYRAGKLLPERVKKLERLGFVWNPLEDLWDYHFSLLLEYGKKNGNLNVPQRYQTGGADLGVWVKPNGRGT